jgi:dTDP-4-dehydrorhamnose reductase
MKKHILVTGGAGQVGLSMQALGNNALVLHTPDRQHLDLMSEDSIRDAVFSRQWSAVINAAAYTAVDKAESEKDIAWQVNAVAPGILAQACSQAKVPLVHISTDYVFSGELARPYVEDDPVGPINVYGASKEAGEKAIRSACESHIIIRTSWVVSAWRSNFLKTMLRLSYEREHLPVVADQTGRPTSAHDLARALLSIAEQLNGSADARFGTFHFANAGATNWADFAREIIRINAAQGGRNAAVSSIATTDDPTLARRPRNSVLSTEKIGTAFGLRIRPWQEATLDIVAKLARRDLP